MRIRTGVIAFATAALLAACGSTSSSSGPRASTAGSSSSAPASETPSGAKTDMKLAISNYAFHPATITVTPGAKLTFANHDQTSHTATTVKPGFDTGTINAGKDTTVTLTKPGTYTYYCQFHAFMHGTVIVR
jgi:plastocyanin